MFQENQKFWPLTLSKPFSANSAGSIETSPHCALQLGTENITNVNSLFCSVFSSFHSFHTDNQTVIDPFLGHPFIGEFLNIWACHLLVKGVYLPFTKDWNFHGSFKKKAMSLILLLPWQIIQLICFNNFLFPELKSSIIHYYHLILVLASQYNEQKIAREK